MRLTTHKGCTSKRAEYSDYGSALSAGFMQELKEQIAREDEELRQRTAWEQMKQNLPAGNCDNPYHDIDDDGSAEYRYTGNGQAPVGELACQACLDNVTDGPTDRTWELYEVIR